MIRLNILKERQKCGCGGKNCKCGNQKSDSKKQSMNSFFSSMKRNIQES
jgi:hypothetical protein